tara:strand:- start:145 stop:258 length:114 start_codon:yes stop_codon:yes gene_type:complete
MKYHSSNFFYFDGIPAGIRQCQWFAAWAQRTSQDKNF